MKKDDYWELIKASLEEKGFDNLVNLASRFLNCPIVILNTTTRIVSYSRTMEPPDDTWRNAVSRGYITLEFAATLANWQELKDKAAPYERMTVLLSNTVRRRRFYKLTAHSQHIGYLNVTETDNNFETQSDEDFIFVAKLLAKELFLQFRFDTAEQKNKRENLLMELVQGKISNRGYFIDRATLVGLDINRPYRVICGNLEHFSGYNADEDSFKNQLIRFFPSSVIVVEARVLTILVSESDFIRLKEDKLTAFNLYLKKKSILCGISDRGEDLFLFDRYKKQAGKACDNYVYLDEYPHNYIFYDEIKIYDILNQLPRSELIYYCNQKIYSLYRYDQSNGTEYLPTLACYLRNNRSVKAAAASLHLHRNTINYRISRAVEIAGLDLDDSNTTNQLLTSCQIIQVIES